MSVGVLLDRAVSPLDALRRAAWGVAGRHRPLARFVARRDARVPVGVTLHAVLAFGLALLCPTLLLVLGPLLLGVAHVAADVRHLVLRRALPSGALGAALVFSVALIALRGLFEAGLVFGSVERVELAVGAAWVATALVVAGWDPAARPRALVGAGALCGVTALALTHPRAARLAFAHLHNVVAIVLWVALFRRRLRTLVVPLVAVAGGALILSSGSMSDVTLAHGAPSMFGLHVLAAADGIAPVEGASLAIGLTSGYAFLQSVHYAVWLLWVPQDDAPGAGLSSFRASARGLLRDFGAPALAGLALLAIVVLAGAAWGALRAQRLYLSLALFHGYLELALGAYFWARGAASARRPS